MKKLKIKNKNKFLIFFSILLILVVTIISILLNVVIRKNENRISNAYEKSNNRSPQNKISDIDKYTQNTSSNVIEETQSSYFQELENILKIDNIDSLYSKMNIEFLTKNGLNENNFKEYVLKNEYVGKFPASTSLTYSIQRDGSYVYRFKCFRDDRTSFYVNLIETKPFEYTLDFSQEKIPTLDVGKYYDYNYDYNLEFEVTELERTEDSIAYQLKVTNNGDREIEFYLNNITDMALEIESDTNAKTDGYVKQSSSVLSSRKYKISKNSYFIKKLYFPLDMQYHSKVKGMIFYNVRIEDINKDIQITF